MDQTKLNSFILPKNVIERMKTELRLSRKSGVEHGFSLCTTYGGDTIIDKHYCVGDSCTVRIERKCDGEKYVGAYHTHPGPGGTPIMSGADMMRACLEEVSCVGGEDNKIKCFVRKKVQPEWKLAARAMVCYYTAEEFNKAIESPMRKRFDDIMTESAKLKDMTERSIRGEAINTEELRSKITAYSNNLNQYIKDTQKHDKKIVTLVDEFFNTVDIR